jgi:hypothetical protein
MVVRFSRASVAEEARFEPSVPLEPRDLAVLRRLVDFAG